MGTLEANRFAMSVPLMVKPVEINFISPFTYTGAMKIG
jgi:hypothetical protein